MLLLSADILSLTNPAWMHVDDPLHYLFAKVHCAVSAWLACRTWARIPAKFKNFYFFETLLGFVPTISVRQANQAETANHLQILL